MNLRFCLAACLLLTSCGPRMQNRAAAVPTVSRPVPGTLAIQVPTCGFRRLEFIGCGTEGLVAIRSQNDWLKYEKGHRCKSLPVLPVAFNFEKEMIVVISGCRPPQERVLIREAKEVKGKLVVTTVKETGSKPSGPAVCQSDAVAVCPSSLPLLEVSLKTAP